MDDPGRRGTPLPTDMADACGPRRRALILVENASVPFDRRVMQEARSLAEAGYVVSVICPADPGEPLRETLEGVTVRRYR